MKQKTQSGVKVFSSAVLRVEPDLASLQFAVSRQAKQPKDTFRETHDAVKLVRGLNPAKRWPERWVGDRRLDFNGMKFEAIKAPY